MPHDRLIGRATGTDTSETYTYWGTSTATISVTAVDSVDGNQTAYADPLAIAPAAPTDLASQWSYTPGSTPSLTLNWTNHSPIADGIEIDELSGDGQTYTTVYTGPIDYDTNSTTISVPNPDPDATYYLYETDNSGTTYSDPATVQPGIVPPTLAVTSNQLTSVTLAYSDPGGANMALYYDIPGVDNMHFCRNLGCGDGTVTVWEPVYDKVYSFQIDAYTDDQDVKSSVVNDLGTPAPIIINAQPVMDGSTYQDEYAITFTTTDPDLRHIGGSGYEAQLALWTGNDTYGLYSANTMGGCSIGEMALSYSPVSESGGVYTITATYYVLSEDSTVSFQIVAPNAPPSEKFTITNAQEVQSCTPVEITGLNADLTRDGMTDIVYNVNIPSGSLAGQPNWSDDYVDFYDVVNGQATFIGEQTDYPLSAGPVGPIYGIMYVGPFVVSNSLIPPGSQVFGVSLWELNTTYAENEWEHSDYSNFFTVPGTASGGVFPNAPSDLTATLIDDFDAFLHWTDNSDNEDTYEVLIWDSAGTGNWATLASGLPADLTSYTLTQAEVTAALGDGATLEGQAVTVAAVDAASPATRDVNIPAPTQIEGLPPQIDNAQSTHSKQGDHFAFEKVKWIVPAGFNGNLLQHVVFSETLETAEGAPYVGPPQPPADWLTDDYTEDWLIVGGAFQGLDPDFVEFGNARVNDRNYDELEIGPDAFIPGTKGTVTVDAWSLLVAGSEGKRVIPPGMRDRSPLSGDLPSTRTPLPGWPAQEVGTLHRELKVTYDYTTPALVLHVQYTGDPGAWNY